MTEKAGIYVHIPFCRSKCAYCSFYSIPAGPGDDIISRYRERVLEEIRFFAENHGTIEADTVYFGGGTPSLTDAEFICSVLEELDRAFRLSGDSEITLEMNPHDLNREKLAELKEAGVNRVVLGVQTLDRDMHSAIGRNGRLCTVNDLDLFFSVPDLTKCVDIIAGLPGQDLIMLYSDLEEIIRRNPHHISLYLLSVEEGTPLSRRFSPDALFEQKQAELWGHAIDFLASKGYEHYEISNFCMPGFESRHNMKYWTFRPYAGFGAGAHSFMDGRRYWSEPSVDDYMDSSFFNYTSDDRGQNSAGVEFLMTALRLIKGFTEEDFEAATGFCLPSAVSSRISELSDQGMMSLEKGRISITRHGLPYADHVIYTIVEPLM